MTAILICEDCGTDAIADDTVSRRPCGHVVCLLCLPCRGCEDGRAVTIELLNVKEDALLIAMLRGWNRIRCSELRERLVSNDLVD